MKSVVSADGTRLALDQVGAGPPVVFVGGALSHRRSNGFAELAALLAERFTVVNYDRRGRGDSEDAPAYSVERELEDLAAVIGRAGGSAHVYGMSSGGVLALRAAAAGVAIDRLVAYEPPFVVSHDAHVPPPDFGEKLRRLLADGDRDRAAEYFMRHGVGAPAPAIAMLRLARPIWRQLTAVAHTLPYDHATMNGWLTGTPLAAEPWVSLPTPTLVIEGARSPASLKAASAQLAERLPHARRCTLPGQAHDPAPEALAPVITGFLAGERA